MLTVGAITASMTAAAANVAGFCDGSAPGAKCTVTETITAPTAVTVVAAAGAGKPTIAWSATCTLDGATSSPAGGTTGPSPLTVPVTLPITDPASCKVSATVSLPTTDTTNALSVAMTYTPTASASPTPSSSPSSQAPTSSGHVIMGYDDKCLDDAGNSSANRAKVQIWNCDTFDKAQLWTYSSGELIHNGLCANDQAWGGNGTKVILYTCNHALNELWTYHSNGQYVLNAKGYKLCLDDPASSTRPGTRLIVYTCKGSANQRWTKP